ncbi:MAG: efflux RND transporter permease subunit [Phycisphaeraceae bacterium]|nr:MAG: efflux RND transporter permease subunit [Phycisphaeraceae bacterium]
MDIIRFCLSKPVTVTVGVILVLMFGLIGLGSMPVQLSPNVDKPIIQINTNWSGRSPEEIVDEITRRQEEELKNIDNLKRMRSTSSEGSSQIQLEFFLGTDLTRALSDVDDALRQVKDLPPDADPPTREAVSGDVENPIAWIILDLNPEADARHPNFNPALLYDALDNEVKPYLERTDGVAEVRIYGGRQREMQVLVDNQRLAQRGLTHIDLIQALRDENVNVSAGTISEGKRDYRVRVMGQFTSSDDILDTIVAYRDAGPIYVRDVATVELSHERARGFVRSLGRPAVAMPVIRRTGANVMEVMEGLRVRLAEVQEEILPRLDPVVGPDLRIRQVYDETIYIKSAVNLVTTNLFIGGGIAIIVLMLFLRSFVATGIIAMAIPISVIGTFLALLAMGRTLNVISLAGLAFAVGMVVDNAIVVLENIFRHRDMGKEPMKAAYDGAREVWGAVLASTLTTVAVFIPVLTVQEEAGQLFRDISLAIASAVVLSLIVSTTVIPTACSRWFGKREDERHGPLRSAFENLFGLAPFFGWVNNRLSGMVYWIMTGWRAWTVRPAVIIVMTGVSVLGALALVPPLDYLPSGNRNLVFGGLLIPPGYSNEQKVAIAERIEAQVSPYINIDLNDRQAIAQLPPIPRPPRFDDSGTPVPQDPFDPVPIENFFIGAFGTLMFVGGVSAYPEVVVPVGQLLSNSMNTTPDAFGGAQQASLFGRNVGGGGTINIEISGTDLDRVKAAAGALFGALMEQPEYGPQNVRPDPSNFNLTQPETQVRLNRLGTELGLRTSGVGTAIRALFDGAFVGDYRVSGRTVDIVVLPREGRLQYKEQAAGIPIATPRGPIVPLSSVVDLIESTAPQEIQRIEELPSVTLRIQPPAGVPLEQITKDLEANYIAPLRDQGLIDPTMRVRLEGTAAQLQEVRSALFGSRSGNDLTWLQNAIGILGLILLGAAAAASVWGFVRAVKRRRAEFAYGAFGIMAFASVIVGVVVLFGFEPQFMTARMVWALMVTYLLMCALFESFTYPFVIMFSVPLAIVGGFLGLRILHDITDRNPLIATQNLDVLTMLGFVILIGVVVNNAILVVHQSLNLMRGAADVQGEEGHALQPVRAIAEAVRTRVRPVFMSTMTSIGGMSPLVIAPGAGSELYRGLGAVVVGGLLVSTVFTLLLVPLVLSFVVQMSEGIRALRGLKPALASSFHDVAAPRMSDDPLVCNREHSDETPKPIEQPKQSPRREREPVGAGSESASKSDPQPPQKG